MEKDNNIKAMSNRNLPRDATTKCLPQLTCIVQHTHSNLVQISSRSLGHGITLGPDKGLAHETIRSSLTQKPLISWKFLFFADVLCVNLSENHTSFLPWTKLQVQICVF